VGKQIKVDVSGTGLGHKSQCQTDRQTEVVNFYDSFTSSKRNRLLDIVGVKARAPDSS
jgi:hypothetical protein